MTTASDRPDELRTLADRAAISDVLHCYATGLDAQDWALWRSAFVTDSPVVFDMRAVTNREPQPQPIDAVIAQVSIQFAGFDATQHLITNHRHAITGDRARVVAHMRAEHWIDPAETAPDGDRYSMFGYYDNDLVRTAEGWKLVSVQLKLTRTEGHPGVMGAAWRKGKRLTMGDEKR
jgi:hypothetical protein